MTLIRLLATSWAVYFFYLLAFPDWKGTSYHFTTAALIIAAAVALFTVLNAFRITSLIGTVIFEICFAVILILYIGWTMPQNSGRPPIQLWIEGHHPNRALAREGISRLRLNPDSKPAQLVIGLFPRR